MKRLVMCRCGCGGRERGGWSRQETRSSTRLTTEHYLDWERVSDAQISPDGTRVALHPRPRQQAGGHAGTPKLWIVNADGSSEPFPRQGIGARWSPDGEAGGLSRRRRAARARSSSSAGSMSTVPATQITRVTDAPRGARWSPDGKSIAFSMFVAEAGQVDDQHAGGAEGRQVDAGAARGRHRCTIARIESAISRRRVHAPVRRPGGRRHAARP